MQRSSSQSDIPGSRRLRTVHTSGSKLKRCASLPARRNLQPKMHQVSTGAATSPTAAAKLKQLSIQSQNQQSSSVESLGKLPASKPDSRSPRSPKPLAAPPLLLAQNTQKKITFEAKESLVGLVHTAGHHLAATTAPSSEHRRCYHGGRWLSCKGLCAPRSNCQRQHPPKKSTQKPIILGI